MKRSHLIVILCAILVTGVCFAGCTTSTPQTLPEATTSVTPVPASSSGANQSEPVSLLFVQEAPSASLVPAGNGTYTLTLSKLVPYTIYFADRPDRIAGSITLEDYLSRFNWSVSPNAAITRLGAKDSEDTMIVALSNPRYNAAANEMIYTVTIISDYKGDKLKELAVKADPKFPTELGRVSLFIDSQPIVVERPMY
jgi:hypothetical protein